MKSAKFMRLMAAFAMAAAAGCATAPVCVVTATPGDHASSALAAGVESDVRSALVAAGHAVLAPGVTNDGAPEIGIRLLVTRSEAARLDDWRAYDGVAAVSIVDEGLLRGEKTFSVQGQRGSTEEDAEAKTRALLSGQLNAWVLGIVPPLMVK